MYFGQEIKNRRKTNKELRKISEKIKTKERNKIPLEKTNEPKYSESDIDFDFLSDNSKLLTYESTQVSNENNFPITDHDSEITAVFINEITLSEAQPLMESYSPKTIDFDSLNQTKLINELEDASYPVNNVLVKAKCMSEDASIYTLKETNNLTEEKKSALSENEKAKNEVRFSSVRVENTIIGRELKNMSLRNIIELKEKTEIYSSSYISTNTCDLKNLS